MGTLGSDVSVNEHVGFLLYWLNAIVFCLKSVKV